MAMEVLVAGEALIDFVQHPCNEGSGFLPLPGGSPYNVAIGLARLGVATGFLGRLSKDLFGRMLRSYLETNGVDLAYLKEGDEPSTLAFVMPGANREPTYAFFGNGTADQAIRPTDLPAMFPATLRAVHVGSYSMACEPIGLALTKLMEREKGRRFLSLDPNIRPSMVGDRAAYLGKLQHWVELADLVKCSRADAAFILPDGDPRDLIERWLGCGPELVVLTAGGDEIVGSTRGTSVTVDVPRVKVADTVGAGDAFMSGLLAWLRNSGRLSGRQLAELGKDELATALTFAARVAAITCTRRGANPPSRAEVDQWTPIRS
ncbi:MAG: carbohydrate kinase [Candidatus Bipolaricaulota bacterium]|nr:carbohydrate kinase [Candidatus Bipolaricaulota bacterium]